MDYKKQQVRELVRQEMVTGQYDKLWKAKKAVAKKLGMNELTLDGIYYKKVSKFGKSLLREILDIKGESITIIYYAITKTAEKYDLTYQEVMSILMNYREDIHTSALKQKFKRHMDFEKDRST